jgi:hypothetical protein
MATIETINGQDLQAKYEALDREIEARLEAAHKSNARGDEARAMYGKIDELKKEFKATFKEIQNHPFVGQKVTVVYYSDKRGGVITEVKGSRFRVEELEYKHTSPYEGECEVSDKSTGNTLGWFSVRKCGVCFEVGYAAANGNVYCTLGYARTYIDPNF